MNKGVGCATCHGHVDQHAADVAGAVAADGVVPRLPPQPRAATSGRASAVFNDGLRSRRPTRLELGPQLVKEYHIQTRSRAARRATDERTQTTTERSTSSALRARLAASRAAASFWRSLDELAETPAFQELLHREFPRRSRPSGSTRSAAATFLKLMGASLALAGVTACTRQPAEKIVPYVRQPEELDPRQAALLRHRDAARRRRDRACSSRATRAGRRRSRATRCTRPASARPTSSRRPRSSASTIPTARRR